MKRQHLFYGLVDARRTALEHERLAHVLRRNHAVQDEREHHT